MAYDEALAGRVRQALSGRDDIVARKMMGALCFMAGGHMCCGVSGSALMVRVGRQVQEEALATPHVRLMEIGGQPVAGFVLVDAAAIPSDEALAEWIRRGTDFTATLPPKKAGRSPARTPRKG